MPALKLDQLYFGKDDAESDIARGGLLREGFLRTQAYQAALDGTKTLIIGRKGSGKSAISLMLKGSLEKEGRACLVTPDEISAEEIRRFQLAGIAPELSKHLIWRYIFNIQISKYLIAVAKSRKDPQAQEHVSVLRKFLVDNGEVDDLSFTEKFWRVIERLKGSVSLEAFSVKLKTDVENQSPGVQTSNRLDVIEERLLGAARSLGLNAESKPFHILVDQIERVWSNDRESDSMVVGLFLASKHIRQYFNFLICTLFVRTDIYEKLQFQDRDKFRGDEFHIEWDRPKLIELITARAAVSCGREVKPNELWGGGFPPQIGEEPIQSFLVSRTLLRPRDVIQLCNACRDKARTNAHSTIKDTDIKEALALYSNWKLSDLQNEWSINFPFLADLFLLFSNSTYVVHRDSFEKTFSVIKTDLITRYPSLGPTVTADKILSNLYSIGFIGLLNGETSAYFYQTGLERRVEPRDKKFIIHPCFRHALQSTSAFAMAPFSSIDPSELVRERFLAEERPFLSFDSYEPSHDRRGIGYIASGLEEVRLVVLKSALPDEVRSEIFDAVHLMQTNLMTAYDDGDAALITRTIERVLRHLSVIGRNLADHNWIERDKGLYYTFQEVCRRIERRQRGDIGSYGAR